MTTSDANTRSNINVTLCVGSGSYTDGLAEELHARGMLTRAIRIVPTLQVWESRNGSFAKTASFPAANFVQRAIWAAWRRTPLTQGLHLPILVTSRITDYIASGRIAPCDIFHGVTGNALHSLATAKRLGVRTVLEHPMAHPRLWQREVLQECRLAGVDPRNCETVLPDSLIRRREREFLLCDRIVVPSSFAKATFAAEGVGTAETILSGIDADLFRPAESPRVDEPFRVCYSGRLDLGKGVLYLLKAWKQLRLKNAELVLMGEVRREIGGLLPKYAGEDAKIMGFLPRVQAAEQLRRSSLFVFPSLHEGLAQSLLEAMASGVPAIATPNSGAEDCITNGEDGFIVRPRSVEEIAEKIEWCYRNREALGWMGQNARTKVTAKFTIEGYRGRVVNFYERLVSGVTGG